MPSLRLRRAVRAAILDETDRILLVRFSFPDRTVWACPGGGIEPDEADADAIERELAEETGLTGATLGPCIWLREHVFPMAGGHWDGQTERFYLIRTAAFDPHPRFSEEELRREYVTGIRWWTQAELGAATEAFAPRRLPELIATLIRDGVPDPPVDAGV